MSRRKRKDVVKVIKYKMIDLGLDQKEFAKKCGIQEGYFSLLLNGKQNWTVITANRIISICPELSLDDFFNTKEIAK